IFPWDKWEVVRERPESPVEKKEKFFELMKKIKKQ
ncbi:MAG: phosphoribosyltransferase, partial [Sulfolobaceae archaeon]